MSSNTALIHTLQIGAGVYKTKLNEKLQIETNVIKNISDADTTNRDRCPENQFYLDTTNKDRRLQKQL